jgi:MYXO-CTERM domain-containing protein
MVDDNLGLFADDSLANIVSATWALADFQSIRPQASVGFVGGSYLFGYATSFSTATTAVPEPSVYAAWAGLAALGFTVWRRQRGRTHPGISPAQPAFPCAGPVSASLPTPP